MNKKELQQKLLEIKDSWWISFLLAWTLIFLSIFGLSRYLPNLVNVPLLTTFLFVLFPVSFDHVRRLLKEKKQTENVVEFITNYLHSELTRNLSMLELSLSQIQSGITKSDKEKGFTSDSTENEKIILMYKFMKVSKEMNKYLTDKFFVSMLTSESILKLGDSTLSVALLEAYEGIFHAQQSARQQASAFKDILNTEVSGNQVEKIREKMLTDFVPGAMNRVREDIGLAIDRVREVKSEFERVIEPLGKKIEVKYRDEIIEEWKTKQNEEEE